MRKVLKYIYCGLVLAALVFLSICVFYIANTYAINTKNKNKPIFDYHSASYFANVANAEIREIEITQSSVPPTDGAETPDGSLVISEPSGELPDNAMYSISALNTTIFAMQEPELEPEPEPDSEPNSELNSEPDSEQEPDIEPEEEPAENESQTELQEEPDNIEQIPFEIEEEENENNGGYYTEADLLYSILVTMKINQTITIFICAVAFIILVFRPVGNAFLDEPFKQ